MTSMIVFLFLIVGMVSFLLYQVAKVNSTLVTTFSILITMALAITASILIHNSLGYARPINLFDEKWVLHYFVPDDASQTVVLMVQASGDKPRLVSYKFSSKEKYEQQKKGLTKAQEGIKNGQMIEGGYSTETEEFRFYEFSMKAKNPKE